MKKEDQSELQATKLKKENHAFTCLLYTYHHTITLILTYLAFTYLVYLKLYLHQVTNPFHYMTLNPKVSQGNSRKLVQTLLGGDR